MWASNVSPAKKLPRSKSDCKQVETWRLSQKWTSSLKPFQYVGIHLSTSAKYRSLIIIWPKEIPELKSHIFAQLAKICPAHATLATNTSSISVTKIAASTKQDPQDSVTPSRVIATHFMNPVPVQSGVEIISGLQTSPETLGRALELVRRMGKVASQSADSPGFLANRILMPYINEAIICLETGIGAKEDIDNIMRLGTNVPMGPLQLADFVGLDTCLAIMRVLHAETGDTKYRPAVLLRKMVDAGWLGKKSGKGFYDY